MSSLISGIDTHTSKQVGENLHVECSYSNDMSEKIVQLFFQLIRCEDHGELESIHQSILRSIKSDLNNNCDSLNTMYKLIGQTRDIVSGKGEQQLAFMQIWGFYVTGFEELAHRAIYHFVESLSNEHPYGSWKDIKYFNYYIYNKSGNENHPLIITSSDLIINRVNKDFDTYNIYHASGGGASEDVKIKDLALTLAGKWCPRGKGKFARFHNIIAKRMFPQFIESAKNTESMRRATVKCRINLTKKITTLNRFLETTQLTQCEGDWGGIDFNKVTSSTMRRQGKAFANITKKGETRSSNEDRIRCASNLNKHFELCKAGSDKSKVHGRRLNVYELVKDIYEEKNANKITIDRINLQWEDNKKNNKGLGMFIPCSDVSCSMHSDDFIPLYSSIGLGIRASEMTHPAFAHRILSFSDIPTWHIFNEGDSFTDKVNKIKNTTSGLGTNFYRALKMVLDVIIINEIQPKEVENMILGIFSDMQIESAVKNCGETRNESHDYLDTMFTTITKMYAEAGLRSKYNTPYPPPHLLFWNLRKTSGFPVVSTQKNVTMLSGYSSTLLNIICDKGIDALKEFTPRGILKDMLNNKRYDVLGDDVKNFVIKKKLINTQ